MRQFHFGQRVHPIGWSKDEIFVVLGTEKNGQIQIAKFNQKASMHPEKLELA